MVAVSQVPWTRLSRWPDDLDRLRAAGFTTAALALSDDAISLDAFVAQGHQKVALITGTEGHGLRPSTISGADVSVCIPMSGEVDSLNIASAAAVALYAIRPARLRG
jgi:tRNA G18 (ribose-2'-O)-methylase SpoU